MTDNVNEKDREWCVKDHLENRIDRNQDGTVFFIASSKTGPDQDHGDASCQTDKDETIAKTWLVWKKRPCESELICYYMFVHVQMDYVTYHKEWGNDPVHDNTETKLNPDLSMCKDEMQSLKFHLA